MKLSVIKCNTVPERHPQDNIADVYTREPSMTVLTCHSRVLAAIIPTVDYMAERCCGRPSMLQCLQKCKTLASSTHKLSPHKCALL